jgi:NAD-dependent SIR2 family protein deacetylase
MENKCNSCHRTSTETEYWWQVIDHPAQGNYSLCPSCYRNKSITAYRDTLLERIKDIQLGHSDPAIMIGMQIMRNRCEAIVRDTVFNV